MTIIYESRNIQIDSKIAKINSISIPIRNIGSVHIKTNGGFGRFLCTILLVFFAFVAIVAFAGSFMPQHGQGFDMTMMTVALVTSAVCLILFYGSRMRSYSLVIRTSSSDQSILDSEDIESLNKIKVAIEKAISNG